MRINWVVLYCFVFAGLYLLIVSALLELALKKLGFLKLYAAEMLEPYSIKWFLVNFVMEFMFFVVIPTLAFEFFHVLLPLTDIRTALAGALVAFVLGVVPAIMGLTVRLSLSMPYLLFFMCAHLLKLGGAMAVVGYIYSM
ncbi:hypothetical protein GF356_09520 [candidate division GN15 bacterium]|nr:hypothetical protein [candidate division GN15 bacterium]